MFSVHNFWYLGLMVVAVTTVMFVGKYKASKLPPKQKALRQLGYSFISFGVIIAFLIFSLPYFDGFDYVPQEIKNLEEAHKILQKQSKSLEEIRDNLTQLRYIIYFFFLFFGMIVLQSIYNFAKAITPNDEEKKPIFGLNDE